MGKYRDHRETRRRGFGEEPLSTDMPPEPSYFQQRPRQAPTSSGTGGATVDAEVLWFNADKGFGFVKTTDGQEAYLHIRVLENSGHGAVGEGMQVKARVEDGHKGKQVTQVFEVSGQARAPAPRAPRPGGAGGGGFQPRDAGPEQEAEGTVKWYNSEKGFGFIGVAGAEKDIFVHASALTRSGLQGLAEGQAVSVRYAQGQKGLEARSVRVI
jgi:cold shock protein